MTQDPISNEEIDAALDGLGTEGVVTVVETVREALRRLLAATPELTVDAVVADKAIPKEWATFFRPLMLTEAAVLIRHRVHEAEAAIPTKKGTPVDPTAARKHWLTEGFMLGDGRRVTWGEATVADHEQRVAMLRDIRDGLSVTINRHAWAIDRITDAKVQRLADVPGLQPPPAKRVAA